MRMIVTNAVIETKTVFVPIIVTIIETVIETMIETMIETHHVT